MMLAPGPLTSADLARVSALGLREVVAGEPPVPVRRTHATERLDPSPALRAGELVCTTGRALVDDDACRAFAATAAAAGAAGICFAPGPVHGHLPRALEAACRELGVALLVARDLGSFPATTEHLARHRDRRTASQHRTGQLLELVVKGLDPEALLPALVDAGLGRTELMASAWPAEALAALPEALGAVPHLLGVVDSGVLVISSADLRVADLAARLDPPSRCGTAPPVPWRDLGTAMRRARGELASATELAQLTPSTDARLIDDLLAHVPAEQLLPFVDRLIRPLVDADERRDSGLVETLRTYIVCDGSLAEVARRQHLHVNSVRHRLSRLRDLTGTDPTTIVGASAFGVALWAYDRTR